ncbi:CMD domain-containing protein [Roseomonas sp. USHLN139]|uniref:CMD domain-containing protein n=1 Tax=Roseomonas sp. USHLN139 TaxID=3081298 RepID=UPI003B0187BB
MPTRIPDLAEHLLGLDAASPLGQLRRQRAEILGHEEGTYRALVLPEDPGQVSLAERAALALRGALIERETALAAHYRALLAASGDAALIAAAEIFPAPPGEDRLAVLFRYADMVAERPADCGQADIDRLTGFGLTPQDIVAVTQLVAFIPYQTRLLAGLRQLQQEPAA